MRKALGLLVLAVTLAAAATPVLAHGGALQIQVNGPVVSTPEGPDHELERTAQDAS